MQFVNCLSFKNCIRLFNSNIVTTIIGSTSVTVAGTENVILCYSDHVCVFWDIFACVGR